MLDAKPAPVLKRLSAIQRPAAVRVELSPVETPCGSVVRDLRLISRGRERKEQANSKGKGAKHHAEDTIRCTFYLTAAPAACGQKESIEIQKTDVRINGLGAQRRGTSNSLHPSNQSIK